MQLPDEIYEEGRARLRRLSPNARAEAAAALKADPMNSGAQAQTSVGMSLIGRIAEDNLDSLVVYHDGAGWQADLVLEDLPAGLPNVLGTPAAQPLATREEAEKAGEAILMAAWIQILENTSVNRDTKPHDNRIFQMGDLEFSIPAGAVEAIRQGIEDEGRDVHEASLVAFETLRQMLPEIKSGEFLTIEDIEALPEAGRHALLRLMAISLIDRRFRITE